MELDGARVLVTGASSGIGAATARQLAERGATVAIVARRAERLAEGLAPRRQHAPESRSFVADLSDPSGAATLARRAWYELGHLDAVVNNAAIPMRRPVTDLTPEVIEQVMTVNFHPPVAICLAVLPAMLERDTGTVVNVASVGGRFGIVHEAAYCAS